MRKFFVLAITFLSLNVSFGNINVIVPALKASEIFIPVGKTGEKISLQELSQIKTKDFELLRGEKMKFFDRLGFKAVQKKLRDNINSDGTLNNKKLVKAFSKDKEGKGGGASGFALGFLLDLIGVLIAYLIKDDHKKNRIKWAWIGFGAFIALALILLASGARLN